jgi:hypothetical protein
MAMTSDKEKAEVKDMIQSLYKYANVLPVWDGDMNERVAEVFGVMLSETTKCSNAFTWIPKPSGGRATISWIVRHLGKGLFKQHQSRLSFTCARGVIYKWARELEMASLGFAAKRLPIWA